MFAKGKTVVNVDKIDEFYLANKFLGVSKIPCVINSPLRNDKHPSFALYSRDGIHVRYKDFATDDCGGIFDLLQKMWGISFKEMLDNISKEVPYLNTKNKEDTVKNYSNVKIKVECKIRNWRPYDYEYWEQFGITKKWLKYAEIYPISYYFVTTREGNRCTIAADKYAYAYVEHKEGKTAIKIYQPYNKSGWKWTSGFDGSIISLWTKVPKEGNKIAICSSVKDALCLWANTGIPAIAVQGEGYAISETAKKELLKRYNKVYIIFDNDIAGINDGKKLAKRTGFENIIIPNVDGAKDIAELYTKTNKEQFKNIILKLFEQ